MGGKADAVVAEVNGPGIVFPETAVLVTAGNFGKAEEMAVGNSDRAAAVERCRLVSCSDLTFFGEQLEVAAGSIMI